MIKGRRSLPDTHLHLQPDMACTNSLDTKLAYMPPCTFVKFKKSSYPLLPIIIIITVITTTIIINTNKNNNNNNYTFPVRRLGEHLDHLKKN